MLRDLFVLCFYLSEHAVIKKYPTEYSFGSLFTEPIVFSAQTTNIRHLCRMWISSIFTRLIISFVICIRQSLCTISFRQCCVLAVTEWQNFSVFMETNILLMRALFSQIRGIVKTQRQMAAEIIKSMINGLMKTKGYKNAAGGRSGIETTNS